MKQCLLIVIFFYAFLLRGLSQTITLTPMVVNSAVNIDSFEVKAKATIKNTSTQTKKFIWTRTIISMTSGWQSLVCDVKACWGSNVSTAPEQIELLANGTSNLDVYIRPNHIAGAATIEMRMTEVGNETNAVTGRYLFSTTTPTRDIFKNSVSNIKLYPNPTTDYFMVANDNNDSVERIVVYNIIGRAVKMYMTNETNRYSLGDLPEGIYMVRLLNNKGGTIKTVRLNKGKAKA